MTGEPPTPVEKEETTKETIKIIEPLSILDVLRISAVLEDTIDQLSILKYIMPVQYEIKQSTSMVYILTIIYFFFYFSISYSTHAIKFNMGNSTFISDKG